MESRLVNELPVQCPRCHSSVPGGHRFCGFCGHHLEGGQALKVVGDPLIGAVVGARYRLISKIGVGGMGTVYKVEHVQMGKLMAMKLLHGDLSRDESMIQRFNREGRAVSRLTSRHTVQVFDYGQSDGLIYLVMEYLQGRDLGRMLQETGPLEPARCAPMLRQIAESLDEAHRKGVVHRDLKPENVFLCAPQAGREVVKVLDFGLAKLTEQENTSGQTLGGALIGTPYYMSPEQISDREVGPHSDIYGLGALVFKLLTGEPPFASRQPMAVLTAHLQTPAPRASERVTEYAERLQVVDGVLMKAMSKVEGERYASAMAFAEAFERALEEGASSPSRHEASQAKVEVGAPTLLDEGVISTRADWDRFERSLKWRRFMSVAGMFAGVLLALGLGYWGVVEGNFFRRDAESEPNDRTVDATEVRLGQTMSGAIGLAAPGQRADQDFFVVRYDGAPGHVLSVSVTGVEGVDLVLEVYDTGGRRQAGADGGGPGQGESLRGVVWSGLPLYVLVRELWTEGIPARAAPDKPYALTATVGPREVNFEREPNALVRDAEPLRPGEIVEGVVSEVKDMDLYALPPIPVEGQMVSATVKTPAQRAMTLAVINGAGRELRAFELRAGQTEHRVSLFVAPVGPQPIHLALRSSAASPWEKQTSKGDEAPAPGAYGLSFQARPLPALSPPTLNKEP